jgi:hypothetical protein
MDMIYLRVKVPLSDEPAHHLGAVPRALARSATNSGRPRRVGNIWKTLAHMYGAYMHVNMLCKYILVQYVIDDAASMIHGDATPTHSTRLAFLAHWPH